MDDYLATKEELRREFHAQAPPTVVIPSSPLRGRLDSSPFFGATSIDGLGYALTSVPTATSEPEEEDEQQDDDHHGLLGIDDFHQVVAAACRQLFAGKHFRQGVLDAYLAFRDRVEELSGLTESDDSTLMGKAFGGKHPLLLVVPDLVDETNKNIQRGMAHLSQGVCALVRNPLAHKSAQLNRAEAMRMVAMIDLLVRRVDDRPQPLADHSPADDQAPPHAS